MGKNKLHHVGIVVPHADRVGELLDLLGLERGQTQYVAEVDEMVCDAGLEVLAKRVFAVADYATGTRDPGIDVAYICRRSQP